MHRDLTIERLYRQHSPRVLATLIRLLGDFELAEEAMQEAFMAAVQQWPSQGVPEHPAAWLIRTGQRRGIDQIRRRQTSRHYAHLVVPEEATVSLDERSIAHDPLRLLFTCCHPYLALDERVALTLREMCGLTTEQVAHALLHKPATLAQRIVRAKRKLREAGIRYEIPDARALPERLPDVLRVIYLVFNEGYSQSAGESLVDVSLSAEAMELAEALARLLPQGEVLGLQALMLLHDARRAARQGAQGELIPLEEQDRARWDRGRIGEGLTRLAQALALTPTGPYTLQASIAAEHARAPSAEATDWARIALLYEALYRRQPSPVVALNRAVAVAMRDGPQAGLALLDALADHKAIVNYHLFHAARADLLRRAGDRQAARLAYARALALTIQQPERRFLQRRLAELNALEE
ncbi:sigma-70 family RNA polymerase sigma factor [Halomonas campisalis]|uniref:Sigma-70 family RNA polymerase sigma factor n=1 Tax=Billgrantia campisalis TaxID=74661 RepID=A0ABS9P872_9GAMM|nr:sigma-70 family RNA polymerase sigma factor [Halomonas campisalis]MCG6657972.1 sigma-70 family RNA polymerase sigma factor [Halomonas campisalis]MDR5863503.1 sigma-70 family RNA polymerase sigma factor [Halomonas campisalis]